MYSFLLVILSVSVLLILHTYLFYPAVMILLFSRPGKTVDEYSENDALPEIAILIAAYNEEKVIEEKIHSVFNSGYPVSKIKVFVGSDASTDRTETIIEALLQKYDNLALIRFPGRVGKIGIINHLHTLSDAELLILTDANVIFNKNTVFELVKCFKDIRTGIVAANIIKISETNEGISYQEKKYLSLENKIKACESNGFNMVMGAEGGCYAIRNSLFTKVPANFIVDDFFITFSVILKKRFVLFSTTALCTEDVACDTQGEYRRKVRISSGNFQNLFFFGKSLLQFWKPLFFLFWSHKVLRWITPLLLLLCLVVTSTLIPQHPFFMLFFCMQVLGFLVPVLNHFFRFKNPLIKFISHFYLMNLALLEGFVKFSKGIKSSIWQPIERNV